MGRAAAGVGRERILDTSLRLFAQRGVDATSLQAIADELGITKAAVYHHFQAKNQIILEVLREGLEGLGSAVEEASLVETPDARAWVVVRALADLIVAHRPSYAVMMNDHAVEAVMRAEPHVAAILDGMESALLGPEPTPDRRLAVALFVAALNAPTRPSLRGDAAPSDDALHARVLALGAHLLDLDDPPPAPVVRAGAPGPGSGG